MMYPYPFWRMRPYGSYGRPPYFAKAYRPTEANISEDFSAKKPDVEQKRSFHNHHYEKSGTSRITESNEQGSSSCERGEETPCDKPIFEIFGIRIFSDDLLLLAILYFLYVEDVHDPELFIAILLLLIS